jgi:hypothetical protein
MSNDVLIATATTMSAIAAIAALSVAWMSLRESRRASDAAKRQSAHAMDLTLQSRLDPMYPDLRKVLGHLEDGVPHDIRHVLIPFFVLFSDAFAAHRGGLLDERDWKGFSLELIYWSQKPTAARAWRAFRQQIWTEGFVEYVDSVIDGPLPYPDLVELDLIAPEITWPTDQGD